MLCVCVSTNATNNMLATTTISHSFVTTKDCSQCHRPAYIRSFTSSVSPHSLQSPVLCYLERKCCAKHVHTTLVELSSRWTHSNMSRVQTVQFVMPLSFHHHQYGVLSSTSHYIGVIVASAQSMTCFEDNVWLVHNYCGH